MINYRIETIPPEKMRYPTVGDWFPEPRFQRFAILVSEMGNWRAEACVAVHELVEQLICADDQVTAADVDKYDAEHEEAGGEPDIPGSPYRRAHFVAYVIEMILAKELGLDWTEYGKLLEAAENRTIAAGNKLPIAPKEIEGEHGETLKNA